MNIKTPEAGLTDDQKAELGCAQLRCTLSKNRIVSVVTQLGMDFSYNSVFEFDPAAAQPLTRSILS